MNPPPFLDELQSLSRTELRRLWAASQKNKPPPEVKLLLLRDLAWQAQEAVPGGLDAATDALLKTAMRQASQIVPDPHSKTKPRRARKPSSSARAKPQLQAGAKLHRTWRGHTYEVEVLEPGKRFGFRGHTYTSLTQIAREITGAQRPRVRCQGHPTLARPGGGRHAVYREGQPLGERVRGIV